MENKTLIISVWDFRTEANHFYHDDFLAYAIDEIYEKKKKPLAIELPFAIQTSIILVFINEM